MYISWHGQYTCHHEAIVPTNGYTCLFAHGMLRFTFWQDIYPFNKRHKSECVEVSIVF